MNIRIGMILTLCVLSLLSCGWGDKFSGGWSNETIDKEILTIKKAAAAI